MKALSIRQPCECLNQCGDDERVKKRLVKPCDMMRRRLEFRDQLNEAIADIEKAFRSPFPREDMPLDAVRVLMAHARRCVCI